MGDLDDDLFLGHVAHLWLQCRGGSFVDRAACSCDQREAPIDVIDADESLDHLRALANPELMACAAC